jgi:hypothetical protein
MNCPVRFVPNLEALGERLTPSAAPIAHNHQDLYLNIWVNQGEVRPRTFAIVDRGPSADGVVLLYSSLPGESST